MAVIRCPNCGSTAQVREVSNNEYVCGCGKHFEVNPCFPLLLEILERRASDEGRDAWSRVAYDNALQMVQYALDGDMECLSQFNY